MSTRCRYFLSTVLFAFACASLLYAEIARGWTEALFLKVKKTAIEATCNPLARNDRKLIYVSCPVVYMHDFRNQLAGTFVQHIAPGTDLTGLSIELRTEIYQWREMANCDDCQGRPTDENGRCGELASTTCRYSFEKVWVSQPLPSGEFNCKIDGQEGCGYPPGGAAAVQNKGTIPPSMESFKKTADGNSISIGEDPGRYYLSEELIAQIPAEKTPLFFTKEGLPTLPGKKTTLASNGNRHQLMLQTAPESAEPDIGDVRAEVSKTDFYNGDRNRMVSIVAEQGPYIHGERHRTLSVWDSELPSWKTGSRLKVDWLEEGSATFDEMIADQRQEALEGIITSIAPCRIFGFACIGAMVLLLCQPGARTWFSTRDWLHWSQATRDMLLLTSIVFNLSLALALSIAALPWLHYWPLCGGLVLVGGIATFGLAVLLLWTLDSWTNFQHAFLGRHRDLAIPSCQDESADIKYEPSRGLGDNDEECSSLGSRASVDQYGAVSSTTAMVGSDKAEKSNVTKGAEP